jgi:hypothetical protein
VKTNCRSGEGKEQLPVEVLGEQECSFLAARWAEEEALAGEGTEVLVATLGIGASDTGHTLAVVVASEKASRHAGDPFEAEIAQFLRVA